MGDDIIVSLLLKLFIDFIKSISVWLSKALVASSNIKISLFLYNALAMAILKLSSLSLIPLSPTFVKYPLFVDSIKS